MYSLVGVNGNAFCVVAYTERAMKQCKLPKEEIKQYKDKAFSGDYDSLLCLSMQMLDKCNEIKGEEDED